MPTRHLLSICYAFLYYIVQRLCILGLKGTLEILYFLLGSLRASVCLFVGHVCEPCKTDRDAL